MQKFGEAIRQVDLLLDEDLDLSKAFRNVLGPHIRTPRLLLHMEFFESHYGKTIHHHAGSFGVQFDTLVCRLGCPQLAKDPVVDFLHRVVSFLVELIDVSFRLANSLRRNILPSGDIFFVPQ